jgi:ribitol 2-dehydrogenase
MAIPLSGRSALITGASSGIGRAFARTFAAEGAHLTLSGRSQSSLEKLAAELGGEHHVVVADITQPGEAERVVSEAEARWDGLDIVMSNAGIYVHGDFATTPMSDIRELVDINIYAAIALVRAALPGMTARATGDIVLTSSIAGHHDLDWEPVYSASKNAIQTFTHTLRHQLAGTGVRVGSIGPGVVLNELWGYPEDDPATASRVADRVADASGILSDDVADAALWMLTRPRHVTIRDVVILPSAQKI